MHCRTVSLSLQLIGEDCGAALAALPGDQRQRPAPRSRKNAKVIPLWHPIHDAAFAMDLLTRIHGQSAKTTANPGFRLAPLTSISGMQPGYAAPPPHMLLRRHVQAPGIPGNITPNTAQCRSARASSANTSARMDGGVPEYAANMKSTLRYTSLEHMEGL